MIYLYIVLTKFHLFIFHINGIVSVEAIKLFGNCEKNFIYYATCVSNFLNDQPYKLLYLSFSSNEQIIPRRK